MSATQLRGEVVAPLAEPHHDGSDLCVLERPDEPGGRAVLRLRAPRDAQRVVLRYVHDGEPVGLLATPDEQTETETWWRAEFPVWNPRVPYRWNVDGRWLNGRGSFAHEVPDADDFVLALDKGGPAWHLESVAYEIFPDRFAASAEHALPEWGVRRGWDELPTGRGPSTPRELFGGDLGGIEQQLDHIERLGANLLYLTPFFPARSNHRYDSTTFDRVDPLLGGDEALRSLLDAAHRRGIRVVGDLTLNHTGDAHEWFLAARDEHAPERDFYLWDAAQPYGYESWFGVRSLPKLNWRSEELRRRMEAVIRRWLDEGLDGWRIDVANMTGRYRDADLTGEVADLTRAAAAEALIVAEHGYDFRADLQGGGWHGAMNYAGFLRPVWGWLRDEEIPGDLRTAFWGIPVPLGRLSGADAVAQMRAFRAGMPWQSTLHSWTLLDSHDTARFRSVAGSRETQLVGVGLQMTTPGVPMLYAGDELGLEGDWGEDARRPMPWARPRDEALLGNVSRLAALRRSSDALAHGGIRYVHVSEDAVAYVRETRDERLLCLAARAAHAPIRVPFAELETLYGEDASDGVLPSDGPSFHVWRIA